jgi:exosortase
MTLSQRHAVFLAYGAAVAAAYVEVLWLLFEHGRRDMSASHLLVIPLVTAALVFQNRERVFAGVQPAARLGAGVILAGLALVWLAWQQGPLVAPGWPLSLAVAGLLVLWVGGFVWCYGVSALRAATFPMCFLVFTIPVPPALLDAVIAVLKNGTTEAVDVLFSATGTPHHRDGFVFWLPDLAIEVADECSGIRSTIALVLTSLLAGYQFLYGSLGRALLVLAVLPITIVKNAIRIVTLSLLSIHVDPSFITGQLHHDGGVAFFLLALAMLAPVLAWLRRVETGHDRRVLQQS